jgi:cell division protein FtsZ
VNWQASGDSEAAGPAPRHDRVGDAAAQPATPMSSSTASSDTVPTSYVPAPVAFVSGDGDDDYASADGTGYADGTAGPLASAGISGGASAATRPEVPRAAPEKSFDSSAPRRRPVVFEEEDDLDVPDFLK